MIGLEPGLGHDGILRRIAAEGALRAKGFVATDAGLRVVQGVGARIELSAPHSAPPAELVGHVVVIRRGRAKRG